MTPQVPHFKGFRPGRGPHGLIVPKGARPQCVIGFPFGGSVTGPFLTSLLRFVLYETHQSEPLLLQNTKPQLRASEMLAAYGLGPMSGLYIDHNRNNICEWFMTTGADWLLQIDSDIEFPASILETMVAAAGSDKKILAASVPLGPPFPSSAWRMTEQPGIWKSVKTKHWCLAKHGAKTCFGDLALASGRWTCRTCGAGYPWDDEQITSQDVLTEAPMACDGLATAVILIHRDALRAIADQAGQCWFFKTLQPRMDDEKSAKAWMSPEGRIADRRFISVGEDLAFCLRARDAGVQPWCFKMPGLRHHKTLPMSHDLEGPEVAEPAEMPAEVAL